jgi:Permeases
MNPGRADEVISGLEAAEEAARSLGTTVDHPFMAMSFLSLSVIPELKLTDQGYVDLGRAESSHSLRNEFILNRRGGVAMASLLENRFHLKEAGTDVRTEILAGITTFMTMAYIIFVNPGILQNAGMPFGALMTATCLASALATFLMAFMANYPIALAPGMGLNAFFAFGVVLGMGISWQVALAAIFVEGILFVLLTLTRIRETIVNGFPKTLKIGISTGIGLFITFIGLQSAGVIVKNDAVLVGLGNLKSVEVLLAFAGFFIMVTLEVRRVKGAIPLGNPCRDRTRHCPGRGEDARRRGLHASFRHAHLRKNGFFRACESQLLDRHVLLLLR